MTRASSLAQRAAAGALLLITPVATQLVFWPDLADMPRGYHVFAWSQLLGWGLFASVCLGLASVHPEAVRNRGGRVGRRVVLGACGLHILFAVMYGASSVVRGEPLESSFLLFALGFLALLVGGITWGLTLRREREPHLRLIGSGFLAAAVLGFVAIAVGDNRVHDITLLGSYAAWTVVGLGIIRGSDASIESRGSSNSSSLKLPAPARPSGK